MIDDNYRQSGIQTYGHQCEICGHSMIEVHHIDYQEHQKIEDDIRKAERSNQRGKLDGLLQQAKNAGYLVYSKGQLSKNDSTKNLAVLCSNCHSLCHSIDYGKNILKVIKPRR